MKRILLTPYPGLVTVTRTREEFAREHKRRTGLAYRLGGDNLGIAVTLRKKGFSDDYLVYAKSAPTLAHELGHVLLKLFAHIDSHPASGGGEPFCYMLSHLMREAAKK